MGHHRNPILSTYFEPAYNDIKILSEPVYNDILLKIIFIYLRIPFYFEKCILYFTLSPSFTAMNNESWLKHCHCVCSFVCDMYVLESFIVMPNVSEGIFSVCNVSERIEIHELCS